MDSEGAVRAQLELARRLLSAQVARATVELRPGELALDLPLPEGAQVVGSELLNGQPVHILFDTSMDVEAAFIFYAERLPALGWTNGAMGRGGGFIPSASPHMPARYTSDSRGEALMLAVTERAEGGSTVQVTLMDAPDRAEQERMRRHQSLFNQAMPALTAPRGSELISEGGGGSDMSWRAYARMTAPLDTAAVIRHFDRQLEADGWTPKGGAVADAAGWSVWLVSIEKRPLIGSLFVLRIPESRDGYLLEARLDACEGRTTGGMWSSYAPLTRRGGPGKRR